MRDTRFRYEPHLVGQSDIITDTCMNMLWPTTLPRIVPKDINQYIFHTGEAYCTCINNDVGDGVHGCDALHFVLLGYP